MKLYDFAVGLGISGTTMWLFGGVDSLIVALMVFMVCDYITGISAAFKEGTLSSRNGFWGIGRKMLTFVFVILGHWLDVITGNQTGFVRDAVLLILISNEGISNLENLGRLGFSIPAPLKNALQKLNDTNKGDKQ